MDAAPRMSQRDKGRKQMLSGVFLISLYYYFMREWRFEMCVSGGVGQRVVSPRRFLICF